MFDWHTGRAFIASVNVTHWVLVAAEEIRPEGKFGDERCFSQTSGSVSVTSAKQLFTFVLQIICNKKHKVLPQRREDGGFPRNVV